MNMSKLANAIEKVCPIWSVNTNGEISFKPEAKDEQKAAAQEIFAN